MFHICITLLYNLSICIASEIFYVHISFFFSIKAMKELATLGPETLKSISGAALQSTAASSAQMASFTSQLVTAGLGAVFVALDIYQFMKTSENFGHGSKTELAERMRSIAEDLEKELHNIERINEFYRKQIHVDIVSDTN